MSLAGLSALEREWYRACASWPTYADRWGFVQGTPYTVNDFAALASAAARLAPDRRMIDAGCGPGIKLAAAALLGFEVLGIEIEPALADEARRLGVPVVTGDVRRYAGWAEFGTVYVNCPLRGPAEAVFEEQVEAQMRPGAVLIKAHHYGAPPGWPAVMLPRDFSCTWGVWVKPS